jgi:hypothetical protein
MASAAAKAHAASVDGHLLHERMAHCTPALLSCFNGVVSCLQPLMAQRELLNAKDVQQARQLSLSITSCRSMCVQLANGYMQISGTQQC